MTEDMEDDENVFEPSDEMRTELLFICVIAMAIRNDDEGFTPRESQQLAGSICTKIEENWAKWGFQWNDRFDQDVGDFLAGADFPHRARALLHKTRAVF